TSTMPKAVGSKTKDVIAAERLTRIEEPSTEDSRTSYMKSSVDCSDDSKSHKLTPKTQAALLSPVRQPRQRLSVNVRILGWKLVPARFSSDIDMGSIWLCKVEQTSKGHQVVPPERVARGRVHF
ncbi:hypothetical protein ACJ73_10258, partial [Blastomyces percursus]